MTLPDTAERMAWIVGVGVAVVAVSRTAWRRRDTDSLLIALTGLVSLVFGLHDWLTNQKATDSKPVFLVPSAGLLFVVIVVRMLVDRFVRASRQLATMNSGLERRAATQYTAVLDNLPTFAADPERASRVLLLGGLARWGGLARHRAQRQTRPAHQVRVEQLPAPPKQRLSCPP